MLNRKKSIVESTKKILIHLETGLMETGGIYGVTDGLLKLVSDISLDDEIGASTASRLIFSVLLLGLIGGLTMRSFWKSKAEEARWAAVEKNQPSDISPPVMLTIQDPPVNVTIGNSDITDLRSPLLNV